MQGGRSAQNDNMSNEHDKNRERQNAMQALFELTPEEQAVMMETRRKTFFTHTMPASLGSMLGMSFLIRRGTISQSKAVLKIFGAGFMGFTTARLFTGKIIMEKVIEDCPDGQLAKLWKAKEAGLTGQAMLDHINSMSSPSRGEAVKEEMEPQPALRETAPIQTGLDDRFRPKVDGFEPRAQKVEEPKKIHSYSQLRELARQERLGPDTTKPSQSDNRGVRPKQAEEEVKFFSDAEPAAPKKRVRRNQYGDEME